MKNVQILTEDFLSSHLKHCTCKSFAHNAQKGRCLIANRSVSQSQ